MEILGKHIGLVMLILVGFYLTPSISYACEKQNGSIEKKSSNRGPLKQIGTSDCFKEISCEKDKVNNNCGEDCKHTCCGCGTSCSSVNSIIPIGLNTTNSVLKLKKQKIGYHRAYFYSGFYSIWQPPKIS